MKKLFPLILLTLFSVGQLSAQPPEPELSMRKGPHSKGERPDHRGKKPPLQLRDLDRLVKQLELQPEQVEALRGILFESGKERLTREGNVKVLEFTMKALLMDENPNTRELRELHEEIYREKSAMAWKRVETELQLKQVLTPEQQRKLRQGKHGRDRGNHRPPRPRHAKGDHPPVDRPERPGPRDI